MKKSMRTIRFSFVRPFFAMCIFFSTFSYAHASNQAQMPPDPGFEVSVKAADVIAEIEILVGTPFRAIASVKKTFKGDAPKMIELEGFNSYNWDTIHRGFVTGSREIVFLSRIGQRDIFTPLTPATPRLTIQPEGVLLVLGDPPFRIPVKKSALEEGLVLLIEANASGKVPDKSNAYLRRLWDENEIEARYLCVAMAGALRNPHVVGLITEASRDKLLKLRLTAIDTLGKIGTPEAVEVLSILLKDEKVSITRQAADVLCRLRSTRTLPDLLEWVRRSGTRTTEATSTKSTKSDLERAKTEAIAFDILILALEAAPLLDHLQLSKVLIEIARSPNDKLARGALAVLSEIAQKEEIPALFELSEDVTYEWRAQAAMVLQRVTLQPSRDATSFKKWWENMKGSFGENTRHDAVNGYARALIKGEARDSWRTYSELLRASPAELALPAVAPLLLNLETEEFFSAEDLSNWKSPLTLPYLIERLGREDRIERRTAQSALARLCFRFPRLKPTILPFLRTGLSDPDDSFRRAAQFLLSQLADVTTLPALVDAMEYQGGREGADSSKAVYAMSARTLGYGAAEPLPDQVAAFQRLRGWWNQTQDKFHPIALSDVDSTAHSLRIWEDLNPQQHQQKLESFLFGLDSRASGEAFCVLHNERAPTDVLWAQVEAKTTIRERSFALLAQFGNGAKIKTFADTLHCTIGVPPEHPLLRALSIVGLASLQNQKNSGSNVLLESLRRGVFNLIQDNVKTTTSNHPTLSAGVYWQRLAILCLALQDRDPESLAYLKTQIEKGLKLKAPDPLNGITVKPSDEMELFRAAFLAVCARSDSTELLLMILKDTEIPAIRETCARELSLRRAHAAVAVIVKILEKSETLEWQDLCRALLPLLKSEDALIVANLLNGVETTSRVAGAFLLNLRPDMGIDEKTLAQLCGGLTDKSIPVRYYCAEALGKRKATSAVRKLCVALSDDDESVRAVVAEALGLIGDETACQLATTASERETQITPRWLRVLALGGGVIQQQSILKFCNSTALSDQRAGLEALSVSKQASASERLVKTFHNDESVMQSIALEALGTQGDKILDALNADLTAPDVATRMRLALLLSRRALKTPKVHAALNTLLTDKDENVQALAKFILERSAKK